MSYKEFEKPLWLLINGKRYEVKIVTGFEQERGEIRKFKIQLLLCLNGRWEEVKRCDTAHGVVHIHKFKSASRPEITELSGDIKELLGEQTALFKQNTENWVLKYLLEKNENKCRLL